MADDTEVAIQRTLGRIEQKLDDHIIHQNDYGKRIGNLEKWRTWVRGVTAALSLVAGYLLAHIAGLFSFHK